MRIGFTLSTPLSGYKRPAPTLTVVVPAYNESETFSICVTELTSLLRTMLETGQIQAPSTLLFVDDGSSDATWALIQEAARQSPLVKGLRLSRNYGHQVALWAGLSEVETATSISIDADLQDDIACIPRMIEDYRRGSDIVYGVRKDRSVDTAFKRITADLFYRMMDWLGVEQIPHHADFRLLSQRACRALLTYSEHNLYLRGMVPRLGFPSSQVSYRRKPRAAGFSKYPLSKMLGLAINGVMVSSIAPLRGITFLGGGLMGLSGLGMLALVGRKFSGREIKAGTTSSLGQIGLAGLQIFCIGLVGEYVGRLHREKRASGRHFISERMPSYTHSTPLSKSQDER